MMAPVKIAIYNITGQLVKTIVDEVKKAGLNSVTWDGKDDKGNRVCDGIYFYRLSFTGSSITKKLTLLK
jgi:flagellar hook assembly protein FlgD